MSKAVFAGSFDPFTLGHADVVERGLRVFDQVVVAIGRNADKHALYTPEQRLRQVQACYAGNSRVSVCLYEGLTCRFAEACGADALLRGLRSSTDLDAERPLALINEQLTGGSLQTVYVNATPGLEAVSSSAVRELLSYGQDVSAFVPQGVLENL